VPYLSALEVCLRQGAIQIQVNLTSEHIRLVVLPKLFAVNSWILQMIMQWILDCWLGNRKCASPNGAMANLWNELHAVFMSAYSTVSLVCGVHVYYAVTLLPWCFCVWRRRVVIETTVQNKSMKLSTASASSVSLMQKHSTNVWGTCHDLTLVGVG